MSIDWGEKPKQTGSLHFNKPEKVREYWVSGTTELVDVLKTLAIASPAVDTFVDVTGADVPIFRVKIQAREAGGGVWEGIVNYEGNPNTFEIDFNIGTQGVKQFLAKEQITTYDCIAGLTLQPGDDYSISNVPDFDKLINVTNQGVDGAEFEFAKVEITVTKKYRMSILPSTYLTTLMNMTPSVNIKAWNITWRSQVFVFDTGTLLLRGTPIKITSDDDLTITYNFAYSPNQTAADAVTVGNSADIVKNGWEYAWPYVRPSTSIGRPLQQTVGVIINRVYDEEDFNQLQI